MAYARRRVDRRADVARENGAAIISLRWGDRRCETVGSRVQYGLFVVVFVARIHCDEGCQFTQILNVVDRAGLQADILDLGQVVLYFMI